MSNKEHRRVVNVFGEIALKPSRTVSDMLKLYSEYTWYAEDGIEGDMKNGLLFHNVDEAVNYGLADKVL